MKHSVPYTPHQNGVAERKNRSLKDMETYLLKARNLPPYLWDETINCASYIQNRIPPKLVIGAIPFEAPLEHKPNVSHLRVFGSNAWDIIHTDNRNAFQDHSSECILLGYVEDAQENKFPGTCNQKVIHRAQYAI